MSKSNAQPHQYMTQHDSSNSNYTDKRTGIVYTDVTTNQTETQRVTLQKTPHLDAFIPDAFLKHYFGKGKSRNDSI